MTTNTTKTNKVVGQNREISDAEVETWALANPHEAKEFGFRLITYASAPDKLDKLPSLGKFQDLMTAWAKKNPDRAKTILLKLLPRIAALTAATPAPKK